MTKRDVYLNHAGTSWPKPRAVAEAVREAVLSAPREWPRRFEEAHRAVAEYFGVHAAEQILLTPGCTSALAVGIGDAFIPDGKRVLTSNWEHHALHRPLLKLASAGVAVEHIPPQRNEATGELVQLLDLQWLERELSRQDVALVAITAACNVTGELLPYEEVTRLARRFGATVLIDAAQIVGWRKLDLPDLGADIVAFGGHKGLQGPWGIGGLFLSERVQMQCATAACELPADGDSASLPPRRPGYCDVGSVDQLALAGLHAAVRMLGEQDAEANLARARQQVGRLRAALKHIDGLQVFGAAKDGMPSLALQIPGCSSGEVAVQLARHGLLVGSGIHCAPLAHEVLGTLDSGLVRLSVGVGQSDSEIDEAAARLPVALREAFS